MPRLPLCAFLLKLILSLRPLESLDMCTVELLSLYIDEPNQIECLILLKAIPSFFTVLLGCFLRVRRKIAVRERVRVRPLTASKFAVRDFPEIQGLLRSLRRQFWESHYDIRH